MTWDVATLATVSGLLMTALGGLWYVFRKIQVVENNTKRLDELESKWDRILEELSKLNTTMTETSVALWGRSGDNGLRGEVKELKEWMWDHIKHKEA